MMPQFKTAYECIYHATEQSKKDGDKLIYYCYGGPANPISHPVPQLLAAVGIEIKSLAGCEIINQEDLWSDAYNLAAKDKQTTHNHLTLGELVEEAKMFERQMGLELTDFITVTLQGDIQGSKQAIIQSFKEYLKTGSIADKVKTEIEWIPVIRQRPEINGSKQLFVILKDGSFEIGRYNEWGFHYGTGGTNQMLFGVIYWAECPDVYKFSL